MDVLGLPETLLADRRPLAASAHFRPAANITDPLPRPILRAAGMSGAVLAEGAVCLLSGAGGAAKSTLSTTLALDVAYGGELADPDGADEGPGPRSPRHVIPIPYLNPGRPSSATTASP